MCIIAEETNYILVKIFTYTLNFIFAELVSDIYAPESDFAR